MKTSTMNGYSQVRRLFIACFVLMMIFLPHALKAQDKPITLEQVWSQRYFSPKGIRMGQSLNDGKRYSIVERNTDLNVYEYETGQLLETLFTTRELLTDENQKPLAINTYSFSDDEKKLLIGVRQEAIFRHSRMAEYYIWDFERQHLEALSEGGKQRLPQFSPDGSMVAFVRDNNIFLKNLNTGHEQAITTDGVYNQVINGTTDWVYEEEFGFTQGFYWAPDGANLAFYRFDESQVKEFTMLLYGELYPNEHRFKYPKAGEDNSVVTIHIYNVETGKTLQVDTGEETDQYIPRIKWTADPEKLAVLRLNRHQNQLEILLAEAASGATSLLYMENNMYYVDITDDLTFLKDEKHFIISSEKSGYNHLYLYDMQGNQVRALTSGEWDVQRFLGVDEDNKRIFYLSHEESPLGNNLYSVRLNGRRKTQLTQGEGTNSPSFSKGFRYYINNYSTANTPPVYSIHRADGTLINVLEDNQQLAARLADHSYINKEFFTITTSDSIDLNAWMIKPSNFDENKQYPVLMYVYGGPGSQTVTQRFDASNGLWYQMLAQMGYVVVSVDNRGTGARGEYFRKMTYQQLGKYESADLIESAEKLGEMAFIDARRIGIFGWSYGGYLSSLCLAKGADQFAAAIAVAPVTNWRFYDTVYTERYMRTPQENPDGYDDNSPVNHVDKIKGSLFLVHGSADDNVHYQNSMEMTTALVEADVPFQMMIYPNHNHGIGGGNARLHLFRELTRFLEDNLKNKKNSVATINGLNDLK
ncbi:MAG: S9 family peptidase [Bacteroidales bacterium]